MTQTEPNPCVIEIKANANRSSNEQEKQGGGMTHGRRPQRAIEEAFMVGSRGMDPMELQSQKQGHRDVCLCLLCLFCLKIGGKSKVLLRSSFSHSPQMDLVAAVARWRRSRARLPQPEAARRDCRRTRRTCSHSGRSTHLVKGSNTEKEDTDDLNLHLSVNLLASSPLSFLFHLFLFPFTLLLISFLSLFLPARHS